MNLKVGIFISFLIEMLIGCMYVLVSWFIAFLTNTDNWKLLLSQFLQALGLGIWLFCNHFVKMALDQGSSLPIGTFFALL